MNNLLEMFTYENSMELYMQMTVAKAREVCKQQWMNEALEIFVDRLNLVEEKDVQSIDKN